MKAIILMSGGLDSTLAAKLIRDLGIELIALHTVSPFCLCDRPSSSGCLSSAARAAKNLGLKITGINVSEEFLRIVENPRFGYGSHMNPCIDCRILLFKKAKELMQKEGASFVITGDVLGQRPMSQRLNAMRLIERESGLEGMVLRPLSAKVMQESIPEKEGWISRDKLLDINGRGRRKQMDLADQFGINDYPCPSGGCLLTDPQFSRRLKDLMSHQQLSLKDVNLLKIGRHFRLGKKTKLIVGRNDRENSRLSNLVKEGDYLFFPDEDTAGPTSLGRGEFDEGMIKLCCGITCSYCDLNGLSFADIIYKRIPEDYIRVLKAAPVDRQELEKFRR